MKLLRAVLLVVAVPLAACSSLHSPLPLTDVPSPAAQSSTVVVGYGRASRFVDGSWVPFPAYDYEFVVLEKRFADRWETVKEIHRRHPHYDGRGGPRDQTLYFVVRTSPAADGGVDLQVESTLGDGKGHEDASGRLFLELAFAERGWLIPFDTIRLRQSRGIANSRIEEVVELLSRREGREIPFMKMEEEGIVYRPVAP